MKTMLGPTNAGHVLPNWPPVATSSETAPPSPSSVAIVVSPPSAAAEPPSIELTAAGRNRRRVGSSPALLLRRHSAVAAINEEDEPETTTTPFSVTDDFLLDNQLDEVFAAPKATKHQIDQHIPSTPIVVTTASSCDEVDAIVGTPTDDTLLDASFSTDDDDPVKCIFLCEFHATAGPTIAAQVPANYISKELFATVNRYIIPKLQLERSFLSVSLLGQKILGYPVRIDNKLYARNAFYFNFCFVFAPTTRTVVYEPVVRKLTEYMVSVRWAFGCAGRPRGFLANGGRPKDQERSAFVGPV